MLFNNKHKTFFSFAASAIITIAGLLLAPLKAYGLGPIEQGILAARSEGQPENLFGTSGIFTNVVNILLFTIGVLSVIMIIIGGMRYVISSGKEASVDKAKNTILYAIIGLVVALLAYAIINFVLVTLMPGSGATSSSNL